MIGVFVTFRYGDSFDEQALRNIAVTARARFEGMPGLRSKAFMLNTGKREAANFYAWDSDQAAKGLRNAAKLVDPQESEDAVAQDVGHGRSRVEPGRRERKPALKLRRGERILHPSPSHHRKREATR